MTGIQWKKSAPIAALSCVLLIFVIAFASCSALINNDLERPTSLVVWSPSDLIHDPVAAKTSEEHFITSLENRTLFGLDAKGKITLELAEKYEVSADGLTITVTLREDSFSDNTTITALDVKASLSRVVLVGGDYSELLQEVKGHGEAKNGTDFFGIATPTADVVAFSLINSDPFFVYHLAHPATAILPAASIGAGGVLTFGAHSGKYTTDSLSNANNATTVYRPRDKELPEISVVRKSEADIAKSPHAKDVDIILGATAKAGSFDQQYIPQLAVASWNLFVKESSSPLADVRFRQAILMVLDNKESIAAYSTRALTPTQLTADTFDGISCGHSCETDKTKAAALVKEVYPDGNVPTITIDIENSEIQLALSTSAVKKLGEIGVPTTVKAHAATDLSNVIARGEVELFRFGWVSDVAIGADPLIKSFKADSTENVSGVSDDELETDIGAYQKSATLAEKTKASHEVQKRIKELWLTRPVAHFHKIVTIEKSLENVSFDYYGRAFISNIRISES